MTSPTKATALALALLIPFASAGESGSDERTSWEDRVDALGQIVKIRGGVESPRQFKSSAQVSYVSPAGGEDSHQVNLGLRFVGGLLGYTDPKALSRFEHGLSAEYHRNTEDGSEVNTHSVGYTVNWRFLESSSEEEDQGLKYSYSLLISSGYKADHEKRADTGYLRLEAVPFRPKCHIGQNEPWFDRALGMIGWQPIVGVLYEVADGSDELDGEAIYGRAGLIVKWEPFDEVPVAVDLRQTYWELISGSDDYNMVYGEHPQLANASLALALGEKGRASIALTYEHGEDPGRGAVDSESTKLVFEFRL